MTSARVPCPSTRSRSGWRRMTDRPGNSVALKGVMAQAGDELVRVDWIFLDFLPLLWGRSFFFSVQSPRIGFLTSCFLHQLLQELGESQELSLHLLERGGQALDQMLNSSRIEFEGIDVAHDVPKAQVLVYSFGSFH